MSEVVQFYYQRRFGESIWFNSWFRPAGKRVSWSSSVDHDVRDTLQLAILTLPIKKENFEKLDMLPDSDSADPPHSNELTHLFRAIDPPPKQLWHVRSFVS